MNLEWLRFSLWMLAYMALALLPMAIALAGPVPELRGRAFALLLVLAHPLALVLAEPAFAGYLDPRDELLP